MHFYHAHTYTHHASVLCAYVLFLVCESRYVSVGMCMCLKSTCSDLCGLGSHAVRESSLEMMNRSRNLNSISFIHLDETNNVA